MEFNEKGALKNTQGTFTEKCAEKRGPETSNVAGGFDATENNKEAHQKLKKQERNHRYYVRHIEQLQEKARNRYYTAREKNEASADGTEKVSENITESVSNYGESAAFLFFLVSAIIALVVFTRRSKQEKISAATVPLSPKYTRFDIGGGRFIDVQTPLNLSS